MKKLIILICLIVFVFSIYQISKYVIETVKTNNIYEGIADIYYGSINNGAEVEDYIEGIREINPQFRGWIAIPDTKIDYPIVKGQDNEYYLTHDIEGNENKHGAIFMDYRNDLTRDRNICLHGHHMKDGTMFRDLVKFKEKDFFHNNKSIFLDIDGKRQEYHVFSVYISQANSLDIKLSFDDAEEYRDYFNRIKSKSLFSWKTSQSVHAALSGI